MKQWFERRMGVVRARQLYEAAHHRLAVVPIGLMLVAVVVSQITLALDRRVGDLDLPAPLTTTVESSRSIFGAMTAGLITTITLLVSMMLVAVQLASAQFSPRTLRNWLGDATLRRTVGVLFAATVFCLMGLRSAQESPDLTVVPTITTLVGVVLGITSLIAVIHAVDHVTQHLTIGTVAQRLTDDTKDIVTKLAEHREADDRRPTAPRAPDRQRFDIPETSVALESTSCGWVQQIDDQRLLDALPAGATAWVVVVHGGYVTSSSPLAWVTTADLDDDNLNALRACFAIGPARTMQQDVGFGLAQLSDIAVRALSPGVNDPKTARDIIVHLGEVMLAIWSHDAASPLLVDGDRTLHRRTYTHAEHLRAAFDPIRHHGRHDPSVSATLVHTLSMLRAETHRRDLPGPTAPLDDFIADVVAGVEATDWLERERRALEPSHELVTS